MVVVNNAAVGTDRHIDSRLLVVGVSGLCHLDQRGGLSPSDALLFTGNADCSAADSNLDKIRSGIGQETEAFRIHHVAGAHFYTLSVILPDIINGNFLPLGKAFRAVDAEHIRPCFQKCGNTLLIISGVDAGAHHVAFGAVDQLVLIFLMAVIILAEYQIHQPPFFIYKRKAVNLVFPDNIVGFL